MNYELNLFLHYFNCCVRSQGLFKIILGHV